MSHSYDVLCNLLQFYQKFTFHLILLQSWSKIKDLAKSLGLQMKRGEELLPSSSDEGDSSLIPSSTEGGDSDLIPASSEDGEVSKQGVRDWHL